MRYEIARLVEECRERLGVSRAELIRRAGYSTVSKGLRRLDELENGELASARGLVERLPLALGVGPDRVRDAVAATKRQLEEEARREEERDEAAWRAAFRPHAVVTTERRVPQPIFIVALIGVDAILRLDFDVEAGPETFLDQALEGVARKIRESGNGSLTGFGRPTGVVVNYSPDYAVRYDLEGRTLKTLNAAYWPGHATLALKGRELSPRPVR